LHPFESKQQSSEERETDSSVAERRLDPPASHVVQRILQTANRFIWYLIVMLIIQNCNALTSAFPILCLDRRKAEEEQLLLNGLFDSSAALALAVVVEEMNRSYSEEDISLLYHRYASPYVDLETVDKRTDTKKRQTAKTVHQYRDVELLLPTASFNDIEGSGVLVLPRSKRRRLYHTEEAPQVLS
jgi:hypothetical protein